MGVVNRVINILVLLFAILAVGFAFTLFNKRERLVKGWDDMASQINLAAKSLDANSGTKLAIELDAKNLDHTKYDNLGKLLPKLSKGASDVAKERDALADGIKDIASKLEIPVTEDDSKALKELASSEAKRADIKGKVDRIQDRNQGIINELVASARKINVTVSEEDLKDVDNFRAPLNKFNARVEAIKKQTNDYSGCLAQIASTLGAPRPNLAEGAYPAALSDLVKFVTGYRGEFETAKRDLAEEKTRSRELKGELEGKDTEIGDLSNEIKKKDAKIAELNKIINPEGKEGELKIVKDGGPEALKMIKGQIVEINPKWDFVVVNVGAKNKVVQKLGQKENSIEAPLPKDKSMTVARGLAEKPEFVAKIKIAKVYDYCAIANVIPSPKGSDIKIGDTVFFSDEDLADMADKKDAKADAKDADKKDSKDADAKDDKADSKDSKDE